MIHERAQRFVTYGDLFGDFFGGSAYEIAERVEPRDPALGAQGTDFFVADTKLPGKKQVVPVLLVKPVFDSDPKIHELAEFRIDFAFIE
ncbi:MAG: hypothetical protein AAF724_16825 [Pseudomonadota bacterium]